MKNTNSNRKDGFQGEKLISIPNKVLKIVKSRVPVLFNIYITHIGYFPKASFHFRERRKGCEDNIFIYCLHGKGYFIVDDVQYAVKPNQFIMIPATDKYIRYWADKEDPWTIYWIHFTGPKINEFNSSISSKFTSGPVNTPFNESAIAIWHNIYQTLEMGYSYENLINANFLLHPFLAAFLFANYHQQNSKTEVRDIISQTIQFMQANIGKKFTVEDLAARHGLSASYFSKYFTQNAGMSPIDYFIHLKMQEACLRLSTGTAKVKTIATDLGYEDPYYFSRLFKKHIGSSPNEYRASVKAFEN